MKRCTVGGQAVLEGVMMRTPSGGLALAVRKSDGSIVKEYTLRPTRARKGTFLGWPVVRGVVAFVESLSAGMSTITRSAELYGNGFEEEEPSKFDKWLGDKLGKSAMDVAMAVAVVLAVALAVGLFVLIPSLATQLIPWGENAPSIWKSLTEGIVRLMIFLGYMTAISLMKDIKRLYMYHGAEHKTIACYEAEKELTIENAMGCTRFHPRCGTNYLFLVMAISILFFALLPYSENLLLRVLTRIVFLPVVAGISYEVLKLAAASDNLLARIVRAPGLFIQRLTTKEPDEDMLEVAFAAFRLAMDPPQTELRADTEKAADASHTAARSPAGESKPEPPEQAPVHAAPQADNDPAQAPQDLPK